MNKLANNISYYVLYAIFVCMLIVLALFYFGGDATGGAVISDLDSELWQPAWLSTLLGFSYLLLAVAILVLFFTSLNKFFLTLSESPAIALRSLLGLLLLFVVLVVSWNLGDGTIIKIQGYEGSGNISFWLKATDMFLYTIYTLLFVAVALVIVSIVKKKLH